MKVRKQLVTIVAFLFIMVCSLCIGNEANAADAAMVENVMNVKCQVTTGTDASTQEAVNLRLVTSVDSLNYSEIGFKIYYNGTDNPSTATPITAKVDTVFKRIVASAESGVDYNYNPKVISTDAEYFATVTLLDIAPKNFDKPFYIKPYCRTLDGQTIYGVSRYVKVSDSYKDVVNVQVKATEAQVANMSVEYDETKLNPLTGYGYDGIYAHLKYEVKDEQSLQSVTKFTVKNSEEEIIDTIYHRNLLTEYTGGTTYDTSWYDANTSANKFVIVTAADLYGLAEVAKKDNFNNDVIYLGADITVNEGDAKTWSATNKPAYEWTEGIGSTLWFGGTFDGFGDTISGIYTYSTEQGVGLFGHTNIYASIKNLRLENSYFETTFVGTTSNPAAIGSVVGISEKTQIDSVYSNAKVVTAGIGVGGLIGWTKAGNEHSIANSQFDGSIVAQERYIGGILGIAGLSTISIQNCLYSGLITSTYSAGGVGLGGIIGNVIGSTSDTQTLKVTDCLIAGEINSAKEYNFGLLVGTGGLFNAELTNVYTYVNLTGKKPSNYSTDAGFGNGAKKTLTNESIEVLTDATATGMTAFDLSLDFADVWVATTNSYPQLKQFATVNAMPADTSWHEEASASKKYTITTMEELYGLAVLAQSNVFTGWEFKLGNDITVNSGESDGWTTHAPKYMWLPIGNSSYSFNGTFDGQGHTIKGIYLKTDATRVGLFGQVNTAQIKNLSLKNSYIESTYDEVTNSSTDSSVGSIAGYATKATLESVYSNATVVCPKVIDGGGLLGRANGNVAHTMTKCWFDGRMEGYKNTGGLAGTVIQGTMQMTNCLNTGIATSDNADTDLNLGGFCGRLLNSATISFVNCINTSDIQVKYGLHVGSYVGYTSNVNQRTTFTNSYSTEKITILSDGVTVNQKVAGLGGDSYGPVTGTLNVLPEEYLQGYWGCQITGFDFVDTWVAKADKTPELKSFSQGKNLSVTDVIVADTTWYDASATNQTIVDEADFYGLMKLSLLGNSFSGKVIKLTDTMVLNEGWKITDGVPVNRWIPIGQYTAFEGSFDGDGNSISGVYVDSQERYVGLFGQADSEDDTMYIGNFTMKDSEFRNAAGYIGAAVGACGVNVNNIYVEDTVQVATTGQVSGGIVGHYGSASTAMISNCWFDGALESTYPTINQNCGGVVGWINKGTKIISNCLNTGSVIGKFAPTSSGIICVGGIVGRVENTSGAGTTYVTIDSCINASDIDVDHQYGAGSVAGNLSTGKVTLTKVYTTNDIINLDNNKVPTYQRPDSVGIGNGSSATFNVDGITEITPEDLNGTNGYVNTNLRFYVEGKAETDADVWVARADEVPALKAFVAETEWLPLASVVRPIYIGEPDTGWLTKATGTENDPYIISTPEELYGLAQESKTNAFSGKFIKLANDIIVNSGEAKKYASNAPRNIWTQIAPNQANAFAGTFDGDGHIISGLYLASSTGSVGLFGETAVGSTVKNLRLENSYFSTSAAEARIGSIVGRGEGNLNTIYSNAIVVSDGTYSGGLVGVMAKAGAKLIDNCWFGGSVNSSKIYTGGIIGDALAGPVTLRNCLNTGTITSTVTSADNSNGGYVGGLIGYLAGVAGPDAEHPATLSGCLNTGNVSTAATVRAATLIGCSRANYLKFEHTYTLNTVSTTVSGGTISFSNGMNPGVGTHSSNDGPVWTKLPILKSNDEMKGAEAYRNTELEFWTKDGDTGAWVTVDGGYPVLKSFVAESEWNKGVDLNIQQVHTDWYRQEKTTENTYTIRTAADLYGLSSLVNAGNTFAGKTIQIASDIDGIVLNEGRTGEDRINWTPIGQSNAFAGIFDGNFKTISGVYCKSNKINVGLFGQTADGSKIQNLSLKDSYFECTVDVAEDKEEFACVGSVVGYSNSDLENVYSKATVKGYGLEIGGIVGGVQNKSSAASGTTPTMADMTTRTYKSCWFDGTITSDHQRVGGIVGGLRQGGLSFEDCLYTGTMELSCANTSKGTRAGGILGYAQNAWTKVMFDNIISAGTIDNTTNNGNVGTVIGRVSGANEGVALTDVYATSGDFYGSSGTTITDTVKEVQADDRLIGYNDYLNGTGLDFGSTWTLRKTGVPALNIFVPSDEEYTYTDDVLALTYWGDTVGETVSLSSAKDMGVSNYVMTLADTSNYYQTYEQKLEDKGFTKEVSNDADADTLASKGVYNVVYTKADGGVNWVLNLTHAGNTKNETYISVTTGRPASEVLSPHMVKNNGITYTANDGYTTSGKVVTLRMNEIYNQKETDDSLKEVNGNGFIIQLPNGHFIINDGGTQEDFKYLIDDLYEMTGGKKPIIEAWTISHFHYDHANVFKGFRDYLDYADKVYVEAIYVNEPGRESIAVEPDAVTPVIKHVRRAVSVLKATGNQNTKVYRYQTGQRFYFEDVTMDVVQAQEQIAVSEYSSSDLLSTNHGQFNTTSTGLMFTIADGTDSGKKVYIGGDQTNVNQAWMMAAYDASLFTDVNVFTALHHGANTLEEFTKWSTNNYVHKFDVVLNPRDEILSASIVDGYVFKKYSSSLIDASKNGIGSCYSYANGAVLLTFNADAIDVDIQNKKTWEYHQ